MFHSNPREFIAESAKFGPIGMAMVGLSNLELTHDNFVLAVHKEKPKFATKLSKSFPRHFRDKTDFLVEAVIRWPLLRKVPIFGDGELNLQWLQYQLDELYELRSVLAHGSIFWSESNEHGIIWRFDSIKRVRKNTWGESSVSVGTSILADITTTAFALKLYLRDLESAVLGQYDWEDSYRVQKRIIQNKIEFAELVEFGIVQVEPAINEQLD